MYRYKPPKSNIWGHSLRNIEPARQRALFAEFLRQAVAEYTFAGGSLTFFTALAPPFTVEGGPWGHATAGDVQRFELLLGFAQNGNFHSLAPEQCEAVLNEIIRDGALIPGLLLLQSVQISKWLINGTPIPTNSHFLLYYGMKPCISTFLEFQTVEQFQHVKKVLLDLHLCTLNEKHLKPMKQRKKST